MDLAPFSFGNGAFYQFYETESRRIATLHIENGSVEWYL